MPHTFTSLRHPSEKLLEAEHFLARLVKSHGIVLQFELNAFLSASRSVTFVMQSAMSKVPGFDRWYAKRQAEMKADNAMRFFLELRNISQKQGPISYVGGSLPGGRWTYRFVGRPHAVPEELVGQDIGAGCASHLTKLSKLLISCSDAFPFHSCPYLAFSEEGMAVLGYSWDDVAGAIGLPASFLDVSGISAAEKLSYLKRQIEPLDRAMLERIAGGQLEGDDGPLHFHKSNGRELVDYMAAKMGDYGADARTSFISSVMQRIDQIDKE